MDLSWLVGQHLVKVSVDEAHTWVFAFEPTGTLSVGCLWRIVEKGRIVLTSEDHDQWFGLPAPVNAVEKATDLLAGQPISSTVLRDGTLDIFIDFVHGRRLEILPTSSGYESWELMDPWKTWTVAQGGGNLVSFK